MNTLQEIPNQELNDFKLRVSQWIEIDEKILDLNF